MLKELPRSIDQKKITNIIYDTLMQNTGEGYRSLFDIDLDMQEVSASEGYIYMDIPTEKGTKRVHLHVTVEDKED